MQRKVKLVEMDNPDVQVRWKKIGGGSFRMGNKIIKPGQIFTATPNQIPKSFRDVVIALDKDVTWEQPTKDVTPRKIEVKTASYTIEPHGKSLFLFDVVRHVTNADGTEETKVMNEKSLKKEIAESFKTDLEKE